MYPWKKELYHHIRNARIEIIGQDDIHNSAQAKAVIAIIKAYGKSPAACIYIEPSTIHNTSRPADILLCHPKVGLIVFEIKGYSIASIQYLKGGSLMVRIRGMIRSVNPIRQAEKVMFDIKDSVTHLADDRLDNHALYNVMVILPNISTSEWVSAGYDQAMPEQQLLFREHIDDISNLKSRISKLVDRTQRKSQKVDLLTSKQLQLIQRVLGDSTVINEHRSPRDWLAQHILGLEIDELVVSEKYLSKEQQTLSRLGINGHPRLIRGVAGSGKTIVLANIVARYLNRLRKQPKYLFPADRKEIRVEVICFNRSLAPLIRKKIQEAYYQQTLKELPEE